jgi:hypothetical protein
MQCRRKRVDHGGSTEPVQMILKIKNGGLRKDC